MILPKNQPVQINLNTSFTNFEGLLNDLRSSRLTGYVSLTSWEYESVILMYFGKPINALEHTSSGQRTGVQAQESIMAKARQADGSISIYRLSDQMVELLSGTIGSEAIYRDQVTDRDVLKSLVARLSGEGLGGYIEIRTPDHKDAATLFIHSGKIIEAVLSAGHTFSPGADVLNQVSQTISNGGVVTVYSTDLAKQRRNVGLIDSFAGQQALFLWEQVLGAVETTVDRSTKPGTFAKMFKEACLALVKEFPLLDPFHGEFEYREGQIKITGKTSVVQFNQALGKCLQSTIRKFADEKTTRAIAESVSAVLQQAKADHSTTITDLSEFGAFDFEYKPSLYERVLSEARPFLKDNTEGFIQRQCQQHLGIEPSALTEAHLPALAQQLESTASLLISKENALDLRKKIEALARQHA